MNKLFTEIGIALSLFRAISISFNNTSAININAVGQVVYTLNIQLTVYM